MADACDPQIFSRVLMEFHSSRYERFVLAAVEQQKELGGMVRLMVGFFVSSLSARWMWQFQVVARTASRVVQKYQPCFVEGTLWLPAQADRVLSGASYTQFDSESTNPNRYFRTAIYSITRGKGPYAV